MSNCLEEFYRFPAGQVRVSASPASGGDGFFRFGPDAIGFGPMAGPTAASPAGILPDAASLVRAENGSAVLPFSLDAVLDNLLRERYAAARDEAPKLLSAGLVRSLYYQLRPWLSDSVRHHLQRLYLRQWQSIPFPRWPVDDSADALRRLALTQAMQAAGLERLPFIWFWPDGAPAAAMMTHDVETQAGLELVPALMDEDERAGIYSSFQLVPEYRYSASASQRDEIRRRGFEVNVHGLDHKGDLFEDRRRFEREAPRINAYIEEYQARGFRAPAMYRNLDWMQELNVAYDMSVPAVAHLEPQRGGCCSLFPYFAGKFVELPLTTIQDYSLLRILAQPSLALWREQCGQIGARHGLISVIVHPDYIFEPQPLALYRGLLAYFAELRDREGVWVARPGDISQWWRDRSQMRLVWEDGGWRILGPNCERARVAYVRISQGHAAYEIAPDPAPLLKRPWDADGTERQGMH